VKEVLLFLSWTIKGAPRAWRSHPSFTSKCLFVVILGVFLRLALFLGQKTPTHRGICVNLLGLMLKWRLRSIILRWDWVLLHLFCASIQFSEPDFYVQVMDIVDQLFVAMFDSLNASCKKELEAIGRQYPFEPLKVMI